jgi:hypothetical protein
MVFRRVIHRPWLASVLVSVAAVAAAAVATAVAAAAVAAAAVAAVAAAADATECLLHRHLRPLHRRNELHSLAQLSVELRQQPGVLHHADRARYWKAPDCNLL